MATKESKQSTKTSRSTFGVNKRSRKTFKSKAITTNPMLHRLEKHISSITTDPLDPSLECKLLEVCLSHVVVVNAHSLRHRSSLLTSSMMQDRADLVLAYLDLFEDGRLMDEPMHHFLRVMQDRVGALKSKAFNAVWALLRVEIRLHAMIAEFKRDGEIDEEDAVQAFAHAAKAFVKKSTALLDAVPVDDVVKAQVESRIRDVKLLIRPSHDLTKDEIMELADFQKLDECAKRLVIEIQERLFGPPVMYLKSAVSSGTVPVKANPAATTTLPTPARNLKEATKRIMAAKIDQDTSDEDASNDVKKSSAKRPRTPAVTMTSTRKKPIVTKTRGPLVKMSTSDDSEDEYEIPLMKKKREVLSKRFPSPSSSENEDEKSATKTAKTLLEKMPATPLALKVSEAPPSSSKKVRGPIANMSALIESADKNEEPATKKTRMSSGKTPATPLSSSTIQASKVPPSSSKKTRGPLVNVSALSESEDEIPMMKKTKGSSAVIKPATPLAMSDEAVPLVPTKKPKDLWAKKPASPLSIESEEEQTNKTSAPFALPSSKKFESPKKLASQSSQSSPSSSSETEEEEVIPMKKTRALLAKKAAAAMSNESKEDERPMRRTRAVLAKKPASSSSSSSSESDE